MDFAEKSSQARREWDDVLKVLKEKKKSTWNILPGKLSFGNEEEIKTFPDKQNLSKFITTRQMFQKKLKGTLQAEMKGY